MKRLSAFALAGFFLLGTACAKSVKSAVAELPVTLAEIKYGSAVDVVVTDESPDIAALALALDGYDVNLDLSACSGLSEIPEKAFFLKSNLKKVILPASVTKIGEKAFACTSLESVDLSNVVEFGNMAFAGTKIKVVELGDNTEVFGAGVFSENKVLESISVAEGNKVLRTVEGVLYSADGLSLLDYPAGKSDSEFTVPDSVISIGVSAFADNEKISKVVLPEMLLRICGYAFRGCSALESIEIPATVVSIGQDAFEGTGLKSVVIPAAVVTMGDKPFNNCKSLVEISVAEKNVAFVSVDGVLFCKTDGSLIRYPAAKDGADYVVPDSIAKIAPFAFEGATKLNSVVITENTLVVEKYAFKNCSALENVEIPLNIEKIGRQAFLGCPVKKLPKDYIATVGFDFSNSSIDAK